MTLYHTSFSDNLNTNTKMCIKSKKKLNKDFTFTSRVAGMGGAFLQNDSFKRESLSLGPEPGNKWERHCADQKYGLH